MGLFDFLLPSTSKRIGSVRQDTANKIKLDWENIQILLQQKSPSQLRQALLVADRCLDSALRDVVMGDSMGERLKSAKDLFEWEAYQKIWEAHKLRNNLIHEANYEPPYFMVTEAINNLKEALTTLNIKV